MNIANIVNIITHYSVINLLILVIEGFLLRLILITTGQKWANTFHHLGTFLILPGISYVITSVIKGDIALSLGMVGALSIIRFRNPVKNPFELTMYFGLLTMGIVASVNIKLNFLIFFLIIVIVSGIFILQNILKKFGRSLFQNSFNDGNEIFQIEATLSDDANAKYINETSMNYYFYDKNNNNTTYRFTFQKSSEQINLHNILLKDKQILNIILDKNN